MQADRGGGNSTPRTGIPVSGCSPRPDLIPVPDSPTPSAQSPAEQQSEVNTHPLDPLCDRTYAPSQVPREDGTQYEKLSWGRKHDQCSQRGYRKTESKAVLKRENRRWMRWKRSAISICWGRRMGNASGHPRRGWRYRKNSWSMLIWAGTRTGTREGSEGLG